jgi:hypothetical protein
VGGRVEQVHVAATAVPEPVLPPEYLGGHPAQVHAVRDREMVRPVGADHRVLGGQVGADPGRDRLLPGRKVHFTRERAGPECRLLASAGAAATGRGNPRPPVTLGGCE